MADNSDSTATGGLLVVLGIIVALGAMYFVFGMKSADSKPDVSIEMPKVDIEAPKVNTPDVNVTN